MIFQVLKKTYAVQAGRELRVLVKPEEISDLESYKVARDIKNKLKKKCNILVQLK